MEKAKQNKNERKIEDGLLMVVAASIYGRKVRALIDSGTTRCFVTPVCETACGLKGTPRDILLELGNGKKYLSKGYVSDVPAVTASFIVKIGLTITALLHDVDLVLGMNWLQSVNPVVDWSGTRLYVANATHTTLLQGDWLAGHVPAKAVTVLSSEDELLRMNEGETRKKIAILKCPRFWKTTADVSNSRTNSFKEGVNYDTTWGYLYNDECKICKSTNECKHRQFSKLYVIKNDDEGIVKVKGTNVNAKLPVRGIAGSARHDLAAAEATLVLVHGKCLVKIGLAISLQPDYYVR